MTLMQIISVLVTSKNPIYQGEKEVKKDYIKKFLRLHVFNLHFYVGVDEVKPSDETMVPFNSDF